ncbi:hypothetical protein QW71_35945 [Paenibacillus sp. IHB B 3415]|jgi:hypothetical protein|uniref:hypothetical protein n=1 Tax=Paenibacillus sp. IHB B 3415 TaxID=867080 RepID=UPI0005737DEC|nr:hypothetical protein [Paenibacillus sp. IHB B 3415]KHL91220.1 hypothetical protein QW71_35945 [Paenibacillus sp. IHB B 3415]
MFSIEVTGAFYIKVANIIAIEGKPYGNLKGKTLYDVNDKFKSYIVKGVALVNKQEYISLTDSMTIQLEPGDYQAEELVGKTLVNFN